MKISAGWMAVQTGKLKGIYSHAKPLHAAFLQLEECKSRASIHSRKIQVVREYGAWIPVQM
jgi:hypothetical protein